METPLAVPALEVRELDHRRRNGIEVFLWWYKESNTLSMTLNDEPGNVSYTFDVPNDKGLDALDHPFVFKEQADAIGRDLFGSGAE